MSRALIVHAAGPGTSVQDLGRPGYLAFGLSRGGAADRLAMAEGAALLGQDTGLAALELVGMGGEFEATAPLRIALTGAPMRAQIDGAEIRWNASHLLPASARLKIGAARQGTYGYLHLGGGVHGPQLLGSQSAHMAAGLGAPLTPGTRLPLGADPKTDTGWLLPADDRFTGGVIRVVSSVQTSFFSAEDLTRFEATAFQKDTRGNRMGVRLVSPNAGQDTGQGMGFQSAAGLSVLSEVIVPGDIQITGDGTPFVLLSECQTTGGYPRIASVLPADLPRVAQAPAGAELHFKFVTLEEAIDIERKARDARDALPRQRMPLIRDPATLPDLLSYQLISGVTAGTDLERPSV